MKTVVILKSETESSDVYAEQLKEHKFNAIFVPTLGFGFKNLDALKTELMQPDKYSGIIFTSPRSVDAVKESLQDEKLPDGWKTLHNYCVGEVTNNLIRASFEDISLRGKETGNANHLADYMKEQFEGNKNLPFLFPCGNLRQDTLIIKLSELGFRFVPCEVYETTSHPDLGENLVNALTQDNVEYLAFFSPSGVNYCIDYLTKNEIKFDGKKLIAIGPSTRKSLEGKGLSVYKTAEKPSVEYLIKALINPTDDTKPKEINGE